MTAVISDDQLNQIIEALYELDCIIIQHDDPDNRLDEGDGYTYPQYSGRSMYGKTCLGFVIDNPVAFAIKLGYALGRLESESDSSWVLDVAGEFAERAAQDNMGRQAILYFPNVQVEGGETRDEL